MYYLSPRANKHITIIPKYKLITCVMLKLHLKIKISIIITIKIDKIFIIRITMSYYLNKFIMTKIKHNIIVKNIHDMYLFLYNKMQITYHGYFLLKLNIIS